MVVGGPVGRGHWGVSSVMRAMTETLRDRMGACQAGLPKGHCVLEYRTEPYWMVRSQKAELWYCDVHAEVTVVGTTQTSRR